MGSGKDLEVFQEIHFPHSLGLLYSAFTYYTGFKVNSGEYKVIGLAPHGKPKLQKAPALLPPMTRHFSVLTNSMLCGRKSGSNALADRSATGRRHIIENYFCRIKDWRRIANCYDRFARNFLAAIILVGALFWIKL